MAYDDRVEGLLLRMKSLERRVAQLEGAKEREAKADLEAWRDRQAAPLCPVCRRAKRVDGQPCSLCGAPKPEGAKGQPTTAQECYGPGGERWCSGCGMTPNSCTCAPPLDPRDPRDAPQPEAQTCPTCEGAGINEDTERCGRCNGTGKVGGGK